MNSNRRVVIFVLSSVSLYLLFSLLAYLFHFEWTPFKRVNLISDIVKEDSVIILSDSLEDDGPLVIDKKPHQDFNLYHRPHYITGFSSDTTKPSLQRFLAKLDKLKKGEKTKIRIAYFGDSMIEGDLMTQTIRKLLQEEFGGSGVGFVPITSIVSKFRQSAYANYSGGWQDESFKNTGFNSKLFLSGHLFRSNGDWVELRDQSITDSAAVIEKSILCGAMQQPTSITVNGGSFPIQASKPINRVLLSKDMSRNIKLSVADERLPVYGVTFETESGIILDNFSFRGITGIEFGKIDSAFLSAVAQNHPYDLLVFQYGVNLLFRPNDKNFSWYAKTLSPVVKKFRNCFPDADFVIVSTADRAFRYGGQYKSAVGIDSLIKVQALLAYETGSGFYNQYETMGGRNSIIDWASRSPSLANKDYVHPNHRGAEILGGYFFDALMKEYRKYTRTR